MAQDGLGTELVISGNSEGGVAALKAVSVEATKLNTAAKEAKDALTNIGKDAPAELKKTATELSNTANAASKMANQMRDAFAASIFGGRQSQGFIEYKAGLLGVTTQLDPLIQKIKQTGQAADATNAAIAKGVKPLNEMGLTAGQLSNSLRNVPSQFTDIIVSLQSGQKPLTVLMQQGGQLKDMFGGVGNAMKAMGGYVLGLVSPFTLTAAAVGTLGYAFYAGRKESEEFNKALIMSGNAAGATMAQLQGLAMTVGKATGQTTGAAAEALALFATNGNIASSSFEKFAGVALAMQKETGIAVADTVKQFAELGKDPLTATLKLNDQYHYLTLSVYEQIKALEEQGRTLEAGKVAQNAYADAMANRMPQLKENLGLVEQAWRGVTSAAKGAWDAMLNVGRQGDPVAEMRIQLVNALAKKSSGVEMYNGQGASLDKEIAMLREGLAIANRVASAKQDEANASAEQNRLVKAQVELDKEHEKYQGKAEQKQREINKLAETYLAAADTKENAAKYIESLAAIEKKFKEIDKAKPKSDAWDTAILKAYTSAMGDLAKIQGDAGAKAQDLSKTQAELLKVQSSPQWAAFSRQQQEQISYAASLSQAEEDSAAAMKATVAERDKYIKSLESSATTIENNLVKLHDETQAYAISVTQHISLAEAIDLVAIARLEEAKAVEMSYGDEVAVAAIQREIDARKLLRAEINKHDAHKTEVDSAKKAAQESAAEWKRGWEETDRIAREAFTGWAENGKSFAETVGSALKKALLSAIYEATFKPIAFQIYSSIAGASPVAGAANSGLASYVGATTGATAFGSGFSSGLSELLQGSSFVGPSASAAGGAIGIGAQVAAAMPYIGAAVLAYTLLTRDHGTPTSNTGNAAATFGATGAQTSYATFFGGSSAGTDKMIANMETAYMAGAKSLGIAVASSQFSFGTNTGRDGQNPQFALGGGAGGSNFYQGETTYSQEAISLAASRAVFAALQGSDLPVYLSKVFDGLTASSMTQQDIASTLAFAGTLKQVRDALTETRTPLQVLQDNVTAGFTALGTSAASFKTDFVKAIDAGITPDNLANWQALGVSMTDLAAAAGDATTVITRSLADIANERKGLQNQLDVLTLSNIELAAKQRAALDASNQALFDQVQAAQAAKDAADALAQSQRDAADAAEQLAAVNQSWQDQLDVLTGKTSERDIALRDATDESTRVIMRQVYAQQDLKTAAEDAADAARAVAEAEKAIASQRYALETQLLTLQGNTTALRNRELALLDPSNRALQQQVWSLEDAAKAQAAYNQALSEAQGRFSAATSALEAAQNAVEGVREKGTNAYLSAQDRVAAAQKRIAEITENALISTAQAAYDSAVKMRDLGKSLREFVGGAIGSPSQNFATLLTKALAGDQAAMSGLSGAATAAADSANKESATSSDARIANARIMADVMRVAKLAESTAIPTVTASQDPMAAANKELAAAQLELSSALGVANTIGASTVRSIEDLVGQYAAANVKLDAAQAEYVAAKQVLEDIKKNTADTVQSVKDLNGKLIVELTANAGSVIEKLITFVTNTDKLPADLLALALSTGDTFTKTVDYLVGSALSDENKILALGVETDFVRTFNFIAGTTLTDDQKRQAFEAVTAFDRTINIIAKSNMTDALMAQAFGVVSDVDRVVNLVAGSSLLSGDLKAQAFDVGTELSRTVSLVAGTTLAGDLKAQAFNAGTEISRTVALLAGTNNLTATQQALALATSSDMTKTINTVVGTWLSATDIALALTASSAATKTFNAALGTTDATAIALASAASATVTRTILAAGGTLTADQRAILTAVASGSSTATLTVSQTNDTTIAFAANDPIRSVFDNISKTNDLLLIANQNQLDAAVAAKNSTVIQQAYTYGSFNALADLWLYATRDSGGLKVQFYRDSKGGTMFANGGAFTNGIVSGPTSFNMGTMGEAGPEAIMPLTNVNGRLGVRSASNDATASEIRALREENKAQALSMVKLQQRFTKIIERWDGNGMPELRAVA